MPDLVNTNEHRVYYGENGEHVVRSGQVFSGSRADADRPGLVPADSDLGREYLAAHAAAAADTSSLDAKQRVLELSLLARGLSTAPLRDAIDERGHAVHGSGALRNPNQPSAGGPITYEGVEKPNQPAPETSAPVDSGGVTTGVPGHDVANPDPRHLSAPAILDRLDELSQRLDDLEGQSQDAADEDDVFASSRAEEVAEELGVSAADLEASDVAPNDDGEYGVDAVRAVAEARNA